MLNYKEEIVFFSFSRSFFFLFCYDLCMKECSEEGRCSADTINSLLINHSVEISKCATAWQTLYLTSKSISFTNCTLFLSIASNIFTSITFQIWRWQSTRMAYISSQCTQHTKKQPKVLVTWVFRTTQLVKPWPIGERSPASLVYALLRIVSLRS